MSKLLDEHPDPEKVVILDQHSPFEAALIDIVQTYRRKNHDYADGESWSSNFEDVARQENMDHPVRAVDALIATKQSRLRALGRKGVNPANESIIDTYLDRAVYAIIAYTLLIDARFK